MMSAKKLFFALCLIFAFIPLTNSKLLYPDCVPTSISTIRVRETLPEIENPYIRKHLTVARECSKLYGIPVSIYLGQAICESGFGKSVLTKKTNNHFGMKKAKSTRATLSFLDDKKDKNGRPIKSKFRIYNDAEESFHDYGRMLSNSARYAHLFQIPASNYKDWANGLQRSGYASNPQYARQLIHVIEKFKLHFWDRSTAQVNVAPQQG